MFRLASIYSNRLSPSRDTCNTFASQDIMKHIATGGLWFDSILKKWVRAGSRILAYIQRKPEHARQLGVPSDKTHITGEKFKCLEHRVLNLYITGEARLPRRSLNAENQAIDHPLVKWNETCSATFSDTIPVLNVFYQANSVKALHGDVAAIGKHVIFIESETRKVSSILL